MLADFLAFTLAGDPPAVAQARGELANGVCYTWLELGVLQLEPAAAGEAPTEASASVASVLLSAGVHGDETAPIELLSRLVADIAQGTLRLACRVLVVLGNPAAMRAAQRYVDDDLNRLFCGRHAQLAGGREKARAERLEALTAQFFAQAATLGAAARWHVDMHTAIRSSVFEQFALLPHTAAGPSRAMFDWLAFAHIAAVLLHTAKGTTYTQFTAETFGALACTLELGKVRPFGDNDLSRFTAADNAARALVAGALPPRDGAAMPRVFTVVDQITKHSDAFELLAMGADVPNFTPFAKGTMLARDGTYRYVVERDEERIVFPNPAVKPGLRAALLVIETTSETLAALGA